MVSSADLKAKEFAVKPVSVNDIVDTNGAGDSFAGGFVAALVLGKSVDEAVNVGHQLGAMCITQVSFSVIFPFNWIHVTELSRRRRLARS